jgi:thiol-disulfide isomerase/thioredoxin
LEEDRLVGKVDVLLIKNSSCNKCIDLSFFPQDLEQVGVFVRDYNVLEFDSPKAKELMEYYLVDRIPVIFLSSDAIEYDFLSSSWENLGTVESDGILIYREAVPYFDVFSGEVKGLVEVTRLEDKNCSDCLDSNLMVDPLKQMGIEIVKDTTIDVSSDEGKALIEKYSITKIPTIIVSSEAEEYIDFFTIWPEVGTQEEDNNFVFRSLEIFEEKFISLE